MGDRSTPYISKRKKLVENATEMTTPQPPTLKNVGDCSPNPPRIDAPAQVICSLGLVDLLL